MVRMRFTKDDEIPLRNRIFELLANSRMSASEDLQALMQCASHIQNIAFLQGLAKECGLKLLNGRTDKHLELYI